MFLEWISRIVKNAVLRGFAEAVAELDLEQDGAPDALQALRGRMTPAALPSPDSNGDTRPARTRSK